MLSKLIGYEFKSTRRIFLPAYAVILLLSIVNSIFIALPNAMDSISIPFGILLTVYILAMFAVCILTFAYMISRFYKNLLGDEGYLMFTLPARPSQLIWAKCITSTLWMLFTTIICCVSLFVLTIPSVITEGALQSADFSLFLREFRFVLQKLLQEHGIHMFSLPLLFIIIGIIWTANFCMHIYACLSIGSLANKHRLGFAFLAYLGFSVLWEIIVLVFASIPDQIIPTWNLALLKLSSIAEIYVVALFFLIYYLIKLVINFVITNYILSRHLNLQ